MSGHVVEDAAEPGELKRKLTFDPRATLLLIGHILNGLTEGPTAAGLGGLRRPVIDTAKMVLEHLGHEGAMAMPEGELRSLLMRTGPLLSDLAVGMTSIHRPNAAILCRLAASRCAEIEGRVSGTEAVSAHFSLEKPLHCLPKPFSRAGLPHKGHRH